MPKRILQVSGSRPRSDILLLIESKYFAASDARGCMAKIASAYLAAKSCPLAEVPACKIAGPFCGDLVTFKGPRDLKNSPEYSMRRTFVGSAKTALSWSIMTASASHEFHNFWQTSMNSCALSYLLSVDCLSSP